MVAIQRQDFLELLDSSASPSVSIYMPTVATGREVRQNPGRLKNLLAAAEEELQAAGTPLRTTRDLLRPAFDLLDNEEFWAHREPGLALYSSPYSFRIHWLPMEVEESVTVGDHYRLRPAMPALDADSFCYVLALSQNQVRLLGATESTIDELSPPGLPQCMAETLNYTAVDRGEQVHSGNPSGHDKQTAVFHGQGGEPDAVKEDLKIYFREIDKAVAKQVHDRRAPVLLACVEYLAPLYRSVTRIPHLIAGTVEGCPDNLSAYQLHERAWPVLDDLRNAESSARLDRLATMGAGDQVTYETRQIISAAIEGRMDTLFVDAKRNLWGTFQPAEGIVDIHDVRAVDDQELIELAACETLRRGGTVHCIEEDQLPTPAPMAAILRF